MHRSRQAGFTMTEMLVVIVVMGILASVAIPRFMTRLPEEERGVRSQLQMMLRHAQKVAIAQRRDTCVIRQATQVIAVYTNAAGCSAALPLTAPGTGDDYVDPIPPVGIVIAGAASIRFNALGQPVNVATGVLLTANQTFTVGSQPVLTVAQETGFVYTP